MKHLSLLFFLVTAVAILSACQGDLEDHTPLLETDMGSEDAPLAIHGDNRPKGSVSLMRAKLAHAQAVLEGIALLDFDQVHDNARNLTMISQETDWQVHRTMEYNVFSTEFRRVTQDMAKNAASKNIHATTLDYMQMIMVCVKCHSHMRSEGLVQLDPTTGLAVYRP